jgi:hypothetical protein
VDQTQRAAGVQDFPELTLGLPPAAPAKRPAALPVRPAPAPASRKGARPLDDEEEDFMHISVMRGDTMDQMQSAGGSRSGGRGPTPDLAVSRRVAHSHNVRALPSERPSMDTVLTRMMPGLRLLGIGVLLMVADIGYAAVNGAAFSVGPVRAFWIAGPLVGFGVVKLVLSLVG